MTPKPKQDAPEPLDPQEDGLERLEDWVLGTEAELAKPKSKFSPKKAVRKLAEKVGLKEKRQEEPAERKPSKVQAQSDDSDLEEVALDRKTNPEKYGKYLLKGEKPDLNVALDQDSSEEDSEGNLRLGDGVDDPSLISWTIYTITIPGEKLSAWAKSTSEKDLALPISITLQAAIYRKLIKEANWVAKITGLAEQDATDFIAAVRKTIESKGAAPSADDLMKGLQPCTIKLEANIAQIIQNYKQTKEELRRFQGKVGVAVGLDVAKVAFHVGHSAATMGGTAPLGFSLAVKNTTDLLQQCAKITSNPGTIAMEIDAGFKALQQVKKQGFVGKNLMQIALSGVAVMGNKTLPLNFDALKKKIEVDHRMAIASLVTAQHRIGKLLAQDAELEKLYHTEIPTLDEKKLNALKRSFPQFLSKQHDILPKLNNSYESRIEKHNQLNRYFVAKLASLNDDNWEYSKDIGNLGEKGETGVDIYEIVEVGQEILELFG